MTEIVIANPPLGIYKNEDITIGQAFYLVQLDAHARARRMSFHENVRFPSYAFNVFGKRGDHKIDPVKFSRDYRSRPSLREKLSLCSSESVSDDDIEVVQGVQEDFRRLDDLGYLIGSRSGEFFLDVAKIKRSFNFGDFLEGVQASYRVISALERYWSSNMDNPHPITKSTKFSINNPLGGQNIGPLFTLSNLWDNKYPNSEFVLAGSERNLTNYIFLRMLSRMVLSGEPGARQIFVYPQLRFSEGPEAWNLEGLLKGDYDSDFLRYALLSPSIGNSGVCSVGFSRIHEGRKFVYNLGNLRRVLRFNPNSTANNAFLNSAINFNLDKHLKILNKGVRDLSTRVRISKAEGSFNQKMKDFEREYSSFVRTASIITPKICLKIMRDENE